MRSLLLSLVFATVCAWGQSPGADNEAAACAQQRSPATCKVSNRDLVRASKDFRHAMELQKAGKTQQAFESVESAARLVPNDLEYLTTREILRQQLVMSHLDSGNQLMLAENTDRATVEFRQALALDPSNEFAQQRLRDSLPPVNSNLSRMTFSDAPEELRTVPAKGVHSY